MVHNSSVVTIRQTTRFRQWFADLRDRAARARILARIDRLAFGNPGDVKSVGGASSNCGSITGRAIACIWSGAASG